MSLTITATERTTQEWVAIQDSLQKLGDRVANPSQRDESVRANLNALPEAMRQRIFAHIALLAEEPVESDFGQVHVLDSRDRLLLAIDQVVFEIFNQFTPQESRPK